MAINSLNKTALVRMLVIMGILLGVVFGFKLIQHLLLSWYLSRHNATTVATQLAQSVSWQPFISANASLRAANGINITTETDGIIADIAATPGSNIHKGDLILHLIANSEKAVLRGLIAEAQLARMTYTRDLAQYAVQAISKQELDSDLAHLRYAVAQVEQAASMVNKKFIRAPFAGTLGIITLSPGSYVKAGTVITSLCNLELIYADFYLPQQMISNITLGQTVKLVSDAYPEQVFTGKITTINPEIDPNTRNVHVEARFANKEHKLLPGMFGTVQIFTGAPQDYVVIPQSAIDFRPYGAVVFVVDHQHKEVKVRQSFIATGEIRDNLVNIVKGIKVGDEVVVAGQDKISDGSPVMINNDAHLVH